MSACGHLGATVHDRWELGSAPMERRCRHRGFLGSIVGRVRGAGCLIGLLAACPAQAHHETAPLERHELRLADASRALPGTEQARQSTAVLRLRLLDAETLEPAGGLVRVTPADGPAEPMRLAGLFERPAGWFSMPGEAGVPVPPGRYRVEATRGIEFEIAESRVTCAADVVTSLVLAPARFYELERRGLRSVNTHLHLLLDARLKVGVDLRSRQAVDDYLQVVGASDSLDLVYVSYLTQPDAEIVSNEYTDADLTRLSRGPVLFGNGVEHRHGGRRILDDPSLAVPGPDGMTAYTAENSSPGFTYGHVLLLGLSARTMPASLGPGMADDPDSTDGVPLRRGMIEAREQDGGVVWCHGSQGTERIPDWLAGLPHAQNIYDGGNQGTFDTVYYPLLNAGLKVPFSTGTDWGFWDLSRVLVAAPGPLTSRAFLAELAAGRTSITNEPILEFSVEGVEPGGTVALPGPGELRVRGRAVGRSDFIRLQVVCNGKVVREAASRPVGRHHEAEIDFPVSVTESGWLALRIPPELPYEIRSRYEGRGVNILGKAIFAHTSPVYLSLDGRAAHDRDAIGRLLARVREDRARIEAFGVFAGAPERDSLLGIYREAEATLRELELPPGAGRSAR